MGFYASSAEMESIFTTGGAVLWSRELDAGMDMTGVNSLIREIFLEDRSGETSYQFVYEASKVNLPLFLPDSDHSSAEADYPIRIVMRKRV
eukprot:1318224-Amorphochlora_amoeboformis.AAC.2